jgi:hypothetical protein
MAFFDRNRDAHPDPVLKADDRHEDGKFKLGPANAQRKQGDNAFAAAKDHIDHAASCARNGDEQGSDFHVGMAQQYATLGAKNHLMGKYTEDTKGKTPMPMLQQQAVKKAEEVSAALVELAKNDPVVKSWDDWNASHHGDAAGGAISAADPHRAAAHQAASSVMARMSISGRQVEGWLLVAP